MFLIYLGTMTLTAFVGVSLSLLISVFCQDWRGRRLTWCLCF